MIAEIITAYETIFVINIVFAFIMTAHIIIGIFEYFIEKDIRDELRELRRDAAFRNIGKSPE